MGNPENSTREDSLSTLNQEENNTPKSLGVEKLINEQKILLDSIEKSGNKQILGEEYKELEEGVKNIHTEAIYALEDLKKEFVNSDIKSINTLDRLYNEIEGYKKFKEILVSNELSPEIKEKVFSILLDEDNEVFINDQLSFNYNGEFLPDKEAIIDFVSEYNLINESRKEEIKNTNGKDETISGKDEVLSDKGEVLSDKGEVLSDKGEVLSDKGEVLSDKGEVLSDKGEVLSDKGEVLSDKIKILDQKINKLPKDSIKDEKLKSLLSEYLDGNADEEKMAKAEEISAYLSEDGVLEKILDEARKGGEENYDKVSSFIKTIASSTGNYELSQKIENYSFSNKTDSSLRNWQIDTFINADKKSNEKYVDTDETPPVAYIVDRETGFRIEVDMVRIPPELTEIRREYQSKKIEMKKKGSVLNSELNDLTDKLQLANDEDKSSIREEIAKKNAEIKAFKEEAQKVEEAFKAELDKYTEQMKISQIEENEKAEKTRDYLNEIGFSLIPQEITNSIIEQLNYEDSLRNNLGLNQKIDLQNGELGFENISSDELLSNQEKVAFAKVVNKMITGNTTGPINIDAIMNGSGVAIPDKEKFDFILEQAGIKSTNGNAIAMENLGKAEDMEENK